MWHTTTNTLLKHGSKDIPKHAYACVYHPYKMNWDELKDHRDSWETASWYDLQTPLKKVFDLQWPPGMQQAVFVFSCTINMCCNRMAFYNGIA